MVNADAQGKGNKAEIKLAAEIHIVLFFHSNTVKCTEHR